jgi:hypothetical protein
LTRQDQPEQPGSEALAHVGQIASVPGAREPVDHLGQDQRGKISQRSPGRHGKLLNAGPPEATNRTASAVNGSGAHKKSGNERAAGKRHGSTEHLQFAEARSAGTLSRQQQAPVHHDHERALFCGKLCEFDCPPVRVTRTSLRSGFYFCTLTFEI